jgi:hypothetical protein
VAADLDRFLQIAGDELSDYWTAHDTLERLPDDVIEAVTATGYLRCAADSSRPDFSTIKNADAQYFYPTLNDTLQIVASRHGADLGARCHSHRTDSSRVYQCRPFMSALRRPGFPKWNGDGRVVGPKLADEHNVGSTRKSAS